MENKYIREMRDFVRNPENKINIPMESENSNENKYIWNIITTEESLGVLKSISENISKDEKHIINFLREMRDFVRNPENNAVGLALPQIGVLKRGFVFRKTINNTINRNVFIVINPRIILKSDKTISIEEGCLSEPNVLKEVKRSKKIKVVYYDENFNERKIELSGIDAIVFQHEFDHLNGVLLSDK